MADRGHRAALVAEDVQYAHPVVAGRELGQVTVTDKIMGELGDTLAAHGAEKLEVVGRHSESRVAGVLVGLVVNNRLNTYPVVVAVVVVVVVVIG